MTKRVTGPDQKPAPHPFYGDNYERGSDPWHPLAFVHMLTSEERARLQRRFVEGVNRLPTFQALVDFRSKAWPCTIFLGDNELHVEYPPEVEEHRQRLEALHESAVAMLKRDIFGKDADG